MSGIERLLGLATVTEWIGAGKGLLDTFKSARELIPKGDKRDELDRKLKEAEQLLKRTDAKLAHELGYELCRCTFPPTVMLYHHVEKAHVCPNDGCGNRVKVSTAEDFQQTRTGDYDPLDWMGR